MSERKVILIDDPAVSDPDWIKRVAEIRKQKAQKALTAALKASRVEEQAN